MEESIRFFMMYNSKIFRNTQIYLDKVLKKYELSSGSYPYLFHLEKMEGISQNKLSKDIGNDKAMSARTIAKLIDLGYVYKKQDERDSRAYRLYLTDKSHEFLSAIHEELLIMVNQVTADLTDEEKQITIQSLKKIYERTLVFKEDAQS